MKESLIRDLEELQERVWNRSDLVACTFLEKVISSLKKDQNALDSIVEVEFLHDW